MTTSPSTMNDAVLVKRYVYDLHDAVGLLHAAGNFPRDDPRPMAWVLDHLREYHFLDISDISHLVHNVYPTTREVDQRCGRLTHGCTQRLYRLFKPMAFEAAEATFLDMRVHCGILTVQLYE